VDHKNRFDEGLWFILSPNSGVASEYKISSGIRQSGKCWIYYSVNQNGRGPEVVPSGEGAPISGHNPALRFLL